MSREDRGVSPTPLREEDSQPKNFFSIVAGGDDIAQKGT